MKIWIFLSVLLVLFFVLVFLRKRKRRKKYIRDHLKHPTGHIQYHRNTQTFIKTALAAKEEKGAKSKSIAVLEFKGDIQASSRKNLSALIDEVILNKECIKEVVVRMESPGGSVTDYGHVYAEMCRIPGAGLSLTVCVDTVAASGGYLASLPAHKIMAAPFAMVGSIGVVSFVPNIRKLLEDLKIEPRTFTAGSYKRTVTLTDDASPEEVEHFRGQLQLIHDQFKLALKKHRPNVNVDEVATGDAWLAATTIEKNLGLVDEIKVSSDYLLELNQEHDLLEFKFKQKPKARWKAWLNVLEGVFRSQI